jgi:hypothetical protein
MCYEGADKFTCISREKQAPVVSLHPGTGIVQTSPQNHTTSEPQITIMIGCWKAPKLDVVPGGKKN